MRLPLASARWYNFEMISLAGVLLLLSGSLNQGGQSPGPRNGHGAAYDLGDHSLVVFGGATADEVRGDTWRWKSGTWRRLDTPSPSPRTFPSLAFDQARNELVLFGGNRVLFGDSTNPPRMLGDTWILRGDRWRLATTEGPPPRAEAVAVYDSRRGRVVLFGGYHLGEDGRTQRLGDTWEWDGAKWTRVADIGPSPRNGAAMAFDPQLGLVLFGGSGGPKGDTWRWDGRHWNRLGIPDVAGRFNSVMARDPGTGRLVRFGGYDGKARVGDSWELGDSAWEQVDSTGPAARNHSTLVSAPDRGSVLLYGGHNGDEVFGDLWERKGGRWVVLEPAAPVVRVPNGH